MQQLYVQYGCGLCAPEGWLSFDASPTLRLQRTSVLSVIGRRAGPVFPPAARVGDIVTGLPVDDGNCEAVYCSHVLEHLSLDDCRQALRNTFRILRPGGRFRLVMPDLRQCVERYTASADPQAAHQLMQETLLGEPQRPRGMRGLVREWLGNSKHRWLWDYPAIEHELRQAGFGDIRRAQAGDSGDPRFDTVEDRGRWDGNLGVECRRPIQ